VPKGHYERSPRYDDHPGRRHDDPRHDNPVPTELTGDLSRADLAFMLECLRFGRGAPLAPVLLDRDARDYLLDALRRRCSP
jgi:hypothetical protein